MPFILDSYTTGHPLREITFFRKRTAIGFAFAQLGMIAIGQSGADGALYPLSLQVQRHE
jgi:hypothetical protein